MLLGDDINIWSRLNPEEFSKLNIGSSGWVLWNPLRHFTRRHGRGKKPPVLLSVACIKHVS
jgi:hypothetical protein